MVHCFKFGNRIDRVTTETACFGHAELILGSQDYPDPDTFISEEAVSIGLIVCTASLDQFLFLCRQAQTRKYPKLTFAATATATVQ